MRVPISATVVVAGCLVALVPAAGSHAASLHSKTTTLPAKGPYHRVVVRDDSGTVRIRSGSTHTVRLVERWNAQEPTFVVSTKNGVLRVNATCPQPATGGVTVGAPDGCSIDLTITIPSDLPVDALADTGDVTVTGIHSARVRARSSIGDVRVVTAAGAYAYRATSDTGAVHVHGVSQKASARRSLVIHSDTGDVTLIGRK